MLFILIAYLVAKYTGDDEDSKKNASPTASTQVAAVKPVTATEHLDKSNAAVGKGIKPTSAVAATQHAEANNAAVGKGINPTSANEYLGKSGALSAPETDVTIENPLGVATASLLLGYLAGGKVGAIKAIKESSKFIKTKEAVGEALLVAQGTAGNFVSGAGNAFRAAQVAANIPIHTGGIQKAVQDGIMDKLGRNHDIEMFKSLEDAFTTRERLSRMGAEGQVDDLLGQADAELRGVLESQFKATKRSGFDSFTVDDILAMDPTDAKKEFGEHGVTLLKKGIDEGFIKGNFSVGGGVFKSKSGGVLRTDLASTSSVLEGLKTAGNQFHIPFMDIKFGDLISSPIQHMAGRKNTMRLVQGIDDTQEVGLLIGKKYFDINTSVAENAVSGSRAPRLNLTHREGDFNFGVGSVGQGVYARRGQLPAQQLDSALDYADAAERPFKAMWNVLKTGVFGVGRKYATEPSLLFDRPRQLMDRATRGTQVVDESVVNLNQTGHIGRAQQAVGDLLNIHPITGAPVAPGARGNATVQNPARNGMGFFDRIKSSLGLQAKGHKFVDKNTGDDLVDVFRPIPKSPTAAKAPALDGENFIRGGQAQGHVGIDAFAYKDEGLSKTQDLLHFGVNRLNDLFGHTFGLGMLPQKDTIFALTQATFAFKGIAIAAGGVGYANYLAGRTIEAATFGAVDANDAKPSSLMLDTYSSARGLLQDFRETIGLTSLAQSLEKAAPGIIESDASNVARIGVGVVGGLMSKSKIGIAAGAAASVLLGDDFTGSIADSAKDVRDVLSGEKEVEMRKGRYWEFGKQAFSGGQIGYYNQGIVARMRSNYKMTDTLYGSETEYYANESGMLTPTNLFGLRKIFEGSRLEDRHRLARPYPGADPKDVDAALNALYGEKGGLDEKLAMGAAGFALKNDGNMEMDITKIGFNTPGVVGYKAEKRNAANHVMESSRQSLVNSIENYTEQFGIYKFLTEAASNVLFGNEQVSKQLASADFMDSTSRGYYDEQLGGLLTLSELPRRFMLSSSVSNARSAYNPLPNLMPDFLPGERSLDPEDQEYPINFHTGDAYGKIKQGEMRLPGEAYERMHRLHSGAPGVYDAMDRFLMLSDVAPGSESYKHYKAIVEGWSKSGALDQYWEQKLGQANDQVAAKLEVHNFRMTPGDAIAQREEMGEDPNFAERGVGFLWEGLTREIIPRFGASVPMLGNFVEDKLFATRDAQETYLNREIYDTDEYDWAKPYETMIRPMVDSLVAKDPLTATVGGGITAFMFAANPASKALFGIAAALGIGGASAGRAVATGSLENGWIPDHVKDRRDVDAYFENIEYMKYRRLEQGARSLGNAEAAEKYRDLRRSTTAGLDYNLSLNQFKYAAMKAMPARERGYFDEFFFAKEEDREDILKYLPDHIKPIYEAAYAKQGDERYQDSLARMTARDSDQRVADYLVSSGRSAPDADWAGWNPEVDFRSASYETRMAMGNAVAADIHRSGLTFVSRNPAIMGEVATFDLDISDHYEGAAGLDPMQMFSLEQELRAAGMSNVYIDNNIGVGQNHLSYDLHQSRRSDIQESYGRV